MKFTTAIASIAAAVAFSSAAAINETQLSNGTYVDLPQEAILSFLDLTDSPDVSVYPISEGSKTGLIFVNSTIVDQAYNQTTALTRKREAVAEAEADPWAWIRMWPGAVMFTKRDAEADPWAWIRMWPGAVMFTKRDAEADANADAEAWAWIRMWPGAVMFTK